MSLWFVLALMTAVAAFMVLWPLRARPLTIAPDADLAVYRAQLAELERERLSGQLAPEEAEGARVEVARRLLAVDARAADAGALAGPAPGRRRAVALATLLGLPLAAAGLYAALGSPGIPSAALATRAAAPENRSVASLVSQVEARLESNPDDARGWEIIAPVYLRLGRYDDAVKARRHVLRLSGPTAAREADYGEALVFAANGVVTAEAKEAFDRALGHDKAEPKARYFVGLAAEQDGRAAEAAAIWRALLSEATADSGWAPLVRRAILRVEPAPEGAEPDERDVAAAAGASPQERAAMVRAMVERLAARLDQAGADPDGWLRLIRAYVVLGESDNARAAIRKARGALAGDAAGLQRVNDLSAALGLQG